jgi:hypothetical protein
MFQTVAARVAGRMAGGHGFCARPSCSAARWTFWNGVNRDTRQRHSTRAAAAKCFVVRGLCFVDGGLRVYCSRAPCRCTTRPVHGSFAWAAVLQAHRGQWLQFCNPFDQPHRNPSGVRLRLRSAEFRGALIVHHLTPKPFDPAPLREVSFLVVGCGVSCLRCGFCCFRCAFYCFRCAFCCFRCAFYCFLSVVKHHEVFGSGK